MEKEKVLEIEITKINDEYSLAKVKKINNRVIKEKEEYSFGYANSSNLIMNIIIYKNPNFYNSISDTIECFDLYLNSKNDCFTIKNELVESLQLFLQNFNEKYGIPKRWRSDDGEKYYYIDSHQRILDNTDLRHSYDDARYELGNYFQTEAEAQRVIDSKEWQEFWAKVRAGEIDRVGEKSWLAKKYGQLGSNWKEDIRQGFKECFRVLESYRVLIFKWNEEQIKLSEILKLTNVKALFGNKRAKTHWLVFMKEQ